MKLLLTSILLSVLTSTAALSNTIKDYHLPISHCYHWIQEANKSYLSYKYEHANENNGELTFHTTGSTSNGSIAGPGLYCAKSPSGSYNYGDRIIRLEFVKDVVIYDAKKRKQYCGVDGNYYKDQNECEEKPWDIKFFQGGGKGNKAWYVISNPNAIKSWSTNSDRLIQDLQASLSVNSSVVTKSHLRKTINLVNNERTHIGEKTYNNLNARISLADIIQNTPEKLAAMPALDNLKRAYDQKIENHLSKEVVTNFYDSQLLRVINDSKLSSSDLNELTENKWFNSKLLDLLNAQIKNDNEQLNLSIVKHYILTTPKKLKISQSYMDSLFQATINTVPYKVIEALEAYNKLGSWFISKSEKIFKISIERILPKSGELLIPLSTKDLNIIVELIGRKKFLMPEYQVFRHNVYKGKVERRIPLDTNKDQFFVADGLKLHLKSLNLKSLEEDCRFFSSFTHGDEIELHIQKNIFIDSLNKKSKKENTKLCSKLVNNVNSIKYTASCSIDDDIKYQPHFKRADVTGSSIQEILNNCTKQAVKEFGKKSSSGIRFLESKRTGFPRKLKGMCYIDDDPGFTPQQFKIGMLYDDSFQAISDQCKLVAESTFPGRSSSRIVKLEMTSSKKDSLKALCQYDDDPDFTPNQGTLGTIFAQNLIDAENKCRDLINISISDDNYSSGINKVEYLIDMPIKAKCHIDDDPDFTRNQFVVDIQVNTAEEAEDTCEFLQKKKYPNNGSFDVIYN
jgi:hypothetical protein